MTKVNKVNDEMELYIDPIGLIQAVKEKTVLYTLTRNTSLRAKRNHAWSQVGEEIVPNWTELSQNEQTLCEAELQKKWNNLKDSFIKAYKKEILSTAAGAKKHKQYVYYEALSFLQPIISQKNIPSIDNALAKTDMNHDTEDTNDMDTSDDDEFFSDETKKETKTPVKKTLSKISHGSTKDLNKCESSSNLKDLKYMNKNKKLKLQDCVTDLVSSINNEKRYDTDDMFLLSLSPHLKQLNEKKKLQTQIDILTLLKQRTLDGEYE